MTKVTITQVDQSGLAATLYGWVADNGYQTGAAFTLRLEDKSLSSPYDQEDLRDYDNAYESRLECVLLDHSTIAVRCKDDDELSEWTIHTILDTEDAAAIIANYQDREEE